MNKLIVRKAAVLGAGVMGAQIAAHLANADVPVVLFDLPAKEGARNGIVNKALDGLKGDNADQDAGVAIVRRALQAPIRQISENAGVEGSIVVGKILENNSPTFGFNAQTEQYVDLVQDGVIDPAKVVRTALQDAASVSGLLITTEAAIVESPKKNAPAGGMPDMGGMGGMDF